MSSDVTQLTKSVGDVDITDTIVSFAGRQLKLNTEEDVRAIVDAINACPELVTLNLEGNTLGVDAAKSLAKSLESKPTLQNMLFKDLFTGRLKSEIPEVLSFVTAGITLSSARIRLLDLSDNAIGPVTMPSLLPFLQSESCVTLETLRLNNCGLGVGGGQILAKGLTNLTNLKTLVCGRNRLEILGAQAIGNSLSKLTTLETLEMPQNGIHTKGIETICKAIEANKGLKNINLNDNNLKVQAMSVASALKKLTAIETINFGDCILKRNGCVAICRALNESNLTNVREIILSGNEIGGQEAIDAIIECCLTIANTTARTDKLKLDISNNNFGESGVETLLDCLSEKIDLIIDDDEGSEDGEDGHVDEDTEETEETEEDESIINESVESGHTKTSEVKDLSESLIEELTLKIENESNDVNDLCSKFVNISINGFDNQTSALKDEALIESELYLKHAIKANEILSMNALLVELGLLKDENGRYKTVADLRGPLSALTHSIAELSPNQKQLLRAFMNRPNKNVEQCGKIKHNLMQKLFI